MSDTMQIRISEKDKKAAEKVFSSMGLSTSAAIKLFIRQTINRGKLPFTPIAKIPNTETVTAFEETESGKNINKYKNAKDAIEAIDTY